MANKNHEWNEKENKYWDKKKKKEQHRWQGSLIYKELSQFNKNNPTEKWAKGQ